MTHTTIAVETQQRVGKEAITQAEEVPLSEGLQFERRKYHAPFATHDQREGMTAFLKSVRRRSSTCESGVGAQRGFQAGVRLGHSLKGLTLGLAGLGNIGRLMAGYGNAFGMSVMAYSPTLTDQRARQAGASAASLADVMSKSDIVSLHVTLRPETVGLIGGKELKMMKPGALLVNTSRGPLVDEAALVAALRESAIRAALDVFDTEPLPADHPLRSTPGTLLSPHIAFATRDYVGRCYGELLENILAFIDGSPIRVVNPRT